MVGEGRMSDNVFIVTTVNGKLRGRRKMIILTFEFLSTRQ